MGPYTLKVFRENLVEPVETIGASRAAEVIEAVSRLLAVHPDCHRVRVYAGEKPLFAVDGSGASVSDHRDR